MAAGTKVASAGTTRTPLTALSTDYVPVDTGGTPTKIALPFLSNMVNVKGYGAKGDTRCVEDASFTGTTVTSATAAFTAADVGKVCFAGLSGQFSILAQTTIVSVTNSTTAVVGASPAGDYANCTLVFGTDDTTALQTAFAAAQAAKSPLYCPGRYLVTALPFDYAPSSTQEVAGIYGDGAGTTVFYPAPNFNFASTSANRGMVVRANANCRRMKLSGFSVDGIGYNYASTTYTAISDLGSWGRWDDIRIGRFANQWGAYISSTETILNKVFIDSNSFGLYVAGGALELFACRFSNNTAQNLLVDSVTGSANNYGVGFRMFGGLIDEAGGASLQVQGSSDDVCFFGVKLFGGSAKYAAYITGSSTAKFFGCEIVDYAKNLNRGGLQIDAGSTAYCSGVRLSGVGTLFAINNAGTFVDLGGNIVGGTGSTGAGAVVANDRKTVGTAVTVANTTMTNLTALTFTLAAGTRVSGRASFFADDATAGDGIKFDLDGGSATFTSFIAQYRLTDGAGVVTVARATAIATDATVATFTNAGLVEIEFSGVVNAAGTLIPRVAKNSGSTGNVTVSAGSNMMLNGLAN